MFERSRQGTFEVIGGSDPLVATTVEQFHCLLESSLTQGFPRIVINLEDVPLIDSAGLESLLDANDRCQERGGSLFLAAPNALCRDILRATRLDESISICADATDAVRRLTQ
jgi:anti-anti-sigma factor